jgi:atypical dual specificity phosphatase
MQLAYYNKMQEGIYLGGLPLKNFNHEILLLELGIKAILSVLEDVELNTETFCSSPVTKEYWKEHGISQLHLSVIDFSSISHSDLHQAADFIHQHKEGIYIHCKAGRGRSVMSYMAYLMKYEGKTYEQAYVETKTNRPSMDLRSWQKIALQEFSEGL